jgi:hypothetical protein
MSLLSMIGWTGSQNQTPASELPEIFPFPYLERDFISVDVQNIYARILTDVLERTQGVPKEMQNLLWDNCVANESSDGLVTLLAKAMASKSELFLVYEPALKVIRKATPSEESVIKADYKKQGQSATGIYITFKNYTRTDMMKLYSGLEYYSIASLYKSMNLSKAIQLKISDLRASVGSVDSADINSQAQALAKGLGLGKDILLDAKDSIDTSKPDLTATNSSMEFIAQKRSFYLGMPASWITGLSPKGLGDSGDSTAKDVERGLKNYYFAIIKPVIETIFGVKTTFKTEDFFGLSVALETLKTFELTTDELISNENKRLFINKLYGLPDDAQGDKPEKIEPPKTI